MLDEPTSALDEQGVSTVRMELQRQRDDGAAILLSSHAPAFSRGLANRFWRIDHGRIQVDVNPESFPPASLESLEEEPDPAEEQD
jgi:ABC-2 type transport system ATP-binding protein